MSFPYKVLNISLEIKVNEIQAYDISITLTSITMLKNHINQKFPLWLKH